MTGLLAWTPCLVELRDDPALSFRSLGTTSSAAWWCGRGFRFLRWNANGWRTSALIHIVVELGVRSECHDAPSFPPAVPASALSRSQIEPLDPTKPKMPSLLVRRVDYSNQGWPTVDSSSSRRLLGQQVLVGGNAGQRPTQDLQGQGWQPWDSECRTDFCNGECRTPSTDEQFLN